MDGPATLRQTFGADPLCPHRGRPGDVIRGVDPDTLRTAVKRSAPSVPGVYGMYDRDGELIYVGKSKTLRSRLMSYFSESNREEKGGRIVAGATAIRYQTTPSEFAALLREQQLIRRFSPRWNVQGVPRRQRPVYLCLGRNPAMFFLAAKYPEGARAVEGPFFGRVRMQLAVECLNKIFGLRDCSSKQVFRFAEQLDLFDMRYRPGCLRLETDGCLGPCAAACTHDEYNAAVNAAESFLDGFNHEPLVSTEDSFERAVANRQYELAGRLNETLKSLRYVDRKLAMLATARRTHTFVYPVAGYDGCDTWYLIHCGEVVDVMAAPRTDAARRKALPTLRQWRASARNRLGRGHGPHPQTLSIVASWFRKHRGELEQTVAPEDLAGSAVKRRRPAAVAT